MPINNVQVYEDDAGEIRWRYVAQNTKGMADSGEGYNRQQGALDALDSIFGGPQPVVTLPNGDIHVLPTPPSLAAALALLSLITGEEWTAGSVLLQADAMQARAKTVLKSKYGLPDGEAGSIVAERWDEFGVAAATVEPAPAMDLSAPVEAPPMSERMAEYKARRDVGSSDGIPPKLRRPAGK